MLRLVAFVVLSLWLGLVQAATITLSRFPPNPGVMPGGGWQWSAGSNFGNPTGPRAWVNGVYGSVPKIAATDVLSLAGKAGPMTVSAVSAAGVADAAAAVGRCVVGMNPVCAAGTAAYLLYKAYRAMPPSDVPGSTVTPDNLDYDPGTAPTLQTQQTFKNPWGVSYSTPGAACENWGQHRSDQGAGRLVGSSVNPDGSNCRAQFDPSDPITCPTTQPGCLPYWNTLGNLNVENEQVTACPAVIDALNSAYNIPAGSPVGYDGKCPTARYNHVPKTPAQVAEIIRAAGQDWTVLGPKLRDGLKDAIDLGGQTVPTEITSSGPASQTGSPTTTTTTGPEGTTTKTTTNTYNYTYSGDTITYYITTVTTTTANGVTTTETTNAPTGTPEPGETDCDKYPKALGCVQMGEPPSDTIKWTEKPLEWAVESLALPSGCPPNWTGTIWHRSISMSYAPACSAAETVAPGIIAMIALACMFFTVKILAT